MGGDRGGARVELLLLGRELGLPGVERLLLDRELRQRGRRHAGCGLRGVELLLLGCQLRLGGVELLLTVGQLGLRGVELSLAVDELRLRGDDLRAAVRDLLCLRLALRLGDERVDDLRHACDPGRPRDRLGDGGLLRVRERSAVPRAEDDRSARAGAPGHGGGQLLGHYVGRSARDRDLARGRLAEGDECAHDDGEGRDPGRDDGEASTRGDPADSVEQLSHAGSPGWLREAAGRGELLTAAAADGIRCWGALGRW